MSLTAYITHPSFFKHEMGADHPECPTRLAAINDYLLSHGLLALMPGYEAPEVTEAQLLRAHSAHYLAELAAMTPATGYAQVDPDTLMNPWSLIAARHAAGAVVLATDLVVTGEVGRAFCAVRPPGHHATRDAAMGFCFYNNVAVGIRHAQRHHGIGRIAVIDFDVHHGNGSEDILAGDEEVLMVSTFQHSLYPYLGQIPRGANMLNVPLAPRTGGGTMRKAVEEKWLPALDNFRPELIYVSAGFDAHREDEMANLGWVDDDYAWLTARIVDVANRYADGRIISTLEGGYALDALARCVGAHVGVMIGAIDA